MTVNEEEGTEAVEMVVAATEAVNMVVDEQAVVERALAVREPEVVEAEVSVLVKWEDVVTAAVVEMVQEMEAGLMVLRILGTSGVL